MKKKRAGQPGASPAAQSGYGIFNFICAKFAQMLRR
jgi:hypothetical protein